MSSSSNKNNIKLNIYHIKEHSSNEAKFIHALQILTCKIENGFLSNAVSKLGNIIKITVKPMDIIIVINPKSKGGYSSKLVNMTSFFIP